MILHMPYLRDQRYFPQENVNDLAKQMDQAYVDIATKVNCRTIGVFAVNFSTPTGEQWYILGSSQKQQTLRQVYTFSSTSAIDHGINFANISGIVRTYGNYTDGTNWYGLIAGTNQTLAGQITFYLSPTQIIFMSGAGAPALSSGTIIIEWLANT